MSALTTIMVGMATGNFFYGIYFNLFVTSTYLLVNRFSAGKSLDVYRSMMFVSGVVLFLTVTANAVLITVRIFQGFLLFDEGPAAFFGDNRQPTALALVVSIISMLVNDAIMIYRLWIVWSHARLVIIFPVLTFLGLTVTTILAVIELSRTDSIALTLSLTPSFVLTLATNVYCTGGIFWKLWSATVTPVDGTNLRDVLAMIVESSLLYTSWALFYTITHQINSNVQYVAIATLPPVAGISNALIQTRLGMGKTIRGLNNSSNTTTGAIRFVQPRGSAGVTSAIPDDFEMKSVGIT
ncbi:hypothetical protein MVEN_01650800 [Mycena venus]|uniref:Uncharacterized protein n=1 Tax=Mycena venus TaxID=2733690 RepID=A0A8H6XR05_9AGAR|nr:hypothetical protein MVEN_01650800 [Mycena venus]